METPLCGTDCHIQKEGLSSISSALKSNTTLQVLDLGGKFLVFLLKESFPHLLLSTGNALDDESVALLADGLTCNSTLQELNLECLYFMVI